jgi:hypothetical protein
MQYRQHNRYKIIYTEHRVVLSIGGSTASLQKAVSNVPLDAKLIDIEEDENHNTTLVFRTEERDGT